LPGEISLTGPAGQQRVIVQRIAGGKFQGEATGSAKLTSSDPNIAAIEGTFVVPRGNGACTLTAEGDGERATATVTVKGFEQPNAWNFRNHVQSVLTKAGCNMGACHGAQAGKKGFKLSLRGYDAATDWHVLTRQARGRRIVPDDPGRSLLLTKPSG